MMTHTLPRVAHEHTERLVAQIDTMPALGDLLLTGTADEIHPRLEEMGAFLTGLLLPHMEAIEPLVIPELERMLQNRHSMTPMKREHAEIRRLVGEFERIRPTVKDAKHSLGRIVAMRRVLFPLYALLKVHTAEEEMYIRIIDRGVAEEAGVVIAASIDHHVHGAG
jgi:hypothetical protein